jgi:DNA-directed RNA polymerase specialized sigma24 family protein
MSLHMTLEPKPTAGAVQERCADRDRELVEALRLHKPIAAELLVATYGDRAYRLARGITGNAQDAEEVVQDVIWTVVRKIDTFRGESAFGSWVYRSRRTRPTRRSEAGRAEAPSCPWMTCYRVSTSKADTSHPWPTGPRVWKTPLSRLICGWR